MESVSETEVTDDGQSFLAMELETLKSIYVNEISVGQDLDSTTVSIDLFPATADKLDEQYVRMTLHFLLSSEYPEEVPKIQIRNPRGLSEEKVECIIKELLNIAESNKGNSMLFEMIEAAKEHLTTGNRPCEECAICLYGFSESDVFTKTECYHYFHSHCLARYAKNFKESPQEEKDPKSQCESSELLCPMCRVPIQFSGDEEDYPSPVESGESKFELTDEMVELQEEMAQLFQKQVEKGGIIDLEAEKNKFLLEISNVSPRANSSEKQESNISMSEIVDAPDDVPVIEAESSKQVNSPVKEKDHKSPSKDTDVRKKYSSYKQQNEARRNYDRQDRKYNRPSYDNDSRRYSSRSRGNNYSDRFNRKRYPRDDATEKSPLEVEENEKKAADDHDDAYNSVAPANDDDGTVVKDDQRKENWYRPRYSPRRYRGPRRGNYNNYEGSARSDRHDYLRKQSSNESDKDATPSEEKGTEAPDHQRERTSYSGNRRNGYRNNRPNVEQDNERAYNWNPQRGARRGYNRPGNHYNNDSKPFVRDRYRNPAPNQSYDDRNRNFQERGHYRGNRRGNYSDGYRPQSRNSGRNNHNRYAEERSNRSVKSGDAETSNTEKSPQVDSNPIATESVLQGASSSNSLSKSSISESNVNSEKKLPSFTEAHEKSQAKNGVVNPPAITENLGSLRTVRNPPPGFANPHKKVIYGPESAKPPPGFNRS